MLYVLIILIVIIGYASRELGILPRFATWILDILSIIVFYLIALFCAVKKETVLCAGQLVNGAMGSVALILNMTGNERYTALCVPIATAVNIGCNILLIPQYGVLGAAIATTSSLVVWNVLLAVLVYRKTGIVSLPLPLRK